MFSFISFYHLNAQAQARRMKSSFSAAQKKIPKRIRLRIYLLHKP